MSWEYKPHQIEKAKQLYAILKDKGYAYLAGKPRSGKTATAILVCEESKANNILVITPKKAFRGWEKALNNLPVRKNYTIINPESLHKVDKKPDLLVVDESHVFGRVGKPTQRYINLRKISKDVPHIHLSGTSIIETPASIYYQMHLPRWSPFMCRNFYDFFRKYGIPKTQYLAGRQIPVYTETKPELLDLINSFTVYMTQEEAGINVQVKDKLIYVELSDLYKEYYNAITKDNYLVIDNIEFIADNTMKERMLLHQIEGGTLKYQDENMKDKVLYLPLKHNNKFKYIENLSKQKPLAKIGVMCHYKAEHKLFECLPNVEVYSSNAHAMGVDLSHLDYFIIYSQDYSGSNHVQRRDRIANMNSMATDTVHFLLVKKAISEQVYKATSKKENFNNSLYVKEIL